MSQINSIILTYLPADILNGLTKYINDIEMNDNVEKANSIAKTFKEYDFIEIGCGTNRIVFRHKRIEKYVFKVALDPRGITDNNLEHALSPKLQPYVTVSYENNGVISVAEKVSTMDSEDYRYHQEEIGQILAMIGNHYVLNDVGPRSFMNWGLREDGNIVILDYAYMTPIETFDQFRCPECGEIVRYTPDLTSFHCDYCEINIPIGELAPTVFDDVLMDGFDATTENDVGPIIINKADVEDDLIGFDTRIK